MYVYRVLSRSSFFLLKLHNNNNNVDDDADIENERDRDSHLKRKTIVLCSTTGSSLSRMCWEKRMANIYKGSTVKDALINRLKLQHIISHPVCFLSRELQTQNQNKLCVVEKKIVRYLAGVFNLAYIRRRKN